MGNSNSADTDLPSDYPKEVVFYHLENRSNTCFCNCVLQAFLFSQYVTSYFYYFDTIKIPEEFFCTPLYQFLKIFSKKLQYVYQSSNFPRDIFIYPCDFLESVYNETDQFIRKQQNDSHEFLLYLISSFDNTILKLKNYFSDEKYSKLQKKKDDDQNNKNVNKADEINIKNILKTPLFSLLFEGSRSSSFECAYCHHIQEKIEKFIYLDIGILSDQNGKELDLQRLIDASLDPDKISEEEGGWVCSNCNKKGVNVEITSYIKDLPCTLIIQLQRFKYSKTTRVMEKNNKYVKIQNEIHLNSGGGPQEYKLKTIICHIGSTLHQGHFVSFHRVPRVKTKKESEDQPNENTSISDDYWIITSDSRVCKVSNQDTIDCMIKGISKDRATYTPYVMLYECSV